MYQAGGSSQCATQICVLGNELDPPHAGKDSDLNTRLADKIMLPLTVFFKETKGAGCLCPKEWFKWQCVGLWISHMFFESGAREGTDV